MKTLLLALTLLTGSAFAETIVHHKKVTLPVQVDDKTVINSNLGYSSFMVKIIVPALADVTLLNHRNLGAGGPCLSTTEAEIPEDVIQGKEGIEKVDFHITISRAAQLDSAKNTCHVTLVEKLEAKIRGKKFTHIVRSVLPQRVVEDCR